MFFSVVIPTYNRLPILQKCLLALENQQFNSDLVTDYEIVVVDDGSSDETILWITTAKHLLPHVKLYTQNHKGAASARNLGVQKALGDWIIFIDSDLVVTSSFLQAHSQTLDSANSNRIFSYGAVINTSNFNDPTSEPYKITDFSAAYFATGNVAIAKKWLLEAGLFDTMFKQYGWEDLELGVRLKKLGLKLIKCPQAVGYHWHPPFNIEQIPKLIEQEIQRGKMGVLFYQKHPTYEVKMMIQMTWIHKILWGVLSLRGALNEKTLKPLLKWLINQGKPNLALEVARIFLNWYNVQGVYAAYEKTK
ncbi:MAG: glycosyltransferase [Cyanobacteria bacterium]|nr:glycosyltransferase [Cyanobacteria bacterium CG_2015-16_32_12]NCO78182.1 glycosyltransferase [Cyanobacteria bacterium CG_2015-22_32_23]NCQ04748.1 glycosyltransferase [Cyanobacteria bacterium CG_2015-09_32_10]NCQ40317.1 glycosyltransferase [Cyanobacteria bacterium CG_2015-04_32_10]NCS84879.1 glycosyltransferase [Cyanobacteria bacterium CG_2015-02_32_10]